MAKKKLTKGQEEYNSFVKLISNKRKEAIKSQRNIWKVKISIILLWILNIFLNLYFINRGTSMPSIHYLNIGFCFGMIFFNIFDGLNDKIYWMVRIDNYELILQGLVNIKKSSEEINEVQDARLQDIKKFRKYIEENEKSKKRDIVRLKRLSEKVIDLEEKLERKGKSPKKR